MENDSPKVGDFVAYYNYATSMHTIGVITEITNKYPIEMVGLNRYTVFWTEEKRFNSHISYTQACQYRHTFNTATQDGTLNLRSDDK
jgi:hypothetical protein